MKATSAATPVEAKQYLEALDRFFAEEEKLLAFSSHDKATQDRDEWVSSQHCSFHMWYVCRGRTRWCDVEDKHIERLLVLLCKCLGTFVRGPTCTGSALEVHLRDSLQGWIWRHM